MTIDGADLFGQLVKMGLPGVEPFDEELSRDLWIALEAKGSAYVPRTHHFGDDRRPRYINRLIRETSPYLLQHAHNPVNWRPWSDEAFAEASQLDRPVLLSIGYSTCHWCHVMERESFEDEGIAAYMNANFVAVKVDREERPDVDSVYMTVVQMMTGGGGWPMTVVLLPDRRPYFGGTYFPPRDGDRARGSASCPSSND
ncbi:MAG: thioredoxin domain-containing protein [Myxococcales bacterium]|nr:thioredoxin domain-containing protein [Myxococcales bacterium]